MNQIRMGTLAIDGTKVRANTSKRKGKRYGRMKEEIWLRSEEGPRWYPQRKWLAEPPFGWIRHVLDFRRFGLRGNKKVRGEWQVIYTALNLKRIALLITA